MRVALVFYGFMRHYLTSLNVWRNRFISPHNAGVFLSTWTTETYKANSSDEILERTKSDKLVSLNDLRMRYNPRQIVIDSYPTTYPSILEKSKHLIDEHTKFRTMSPENEHLSRFDTPLNAISMWNRWNEIWCQHAEELMTYDIIFLSRSDFILERIPTLTLSSDTITTEMWPPYGPPQSWVNYEIGINDWWAYGNASAMRTFCTLYDRLDEVIEARRKEYGLWESTNVHGIPWTNAVMNGLRVEKVPPIGDVRRDI